MEEKSALILQDLGDGLIIRRAAAADAERVAAFNARIHGEDPFDEVAVAEWTRDLMRGQHPTFCPEDCLIVENTATGEIVSSMNIIPQTWSYEGIPFKVGRPELVGTDDKYRNRGLVRKQFDIIHEWSRQRGDLVQVITGIPYYYRQFGYEMALTLGGGRFGGEPHVPALAEGEEEPYLFRPPTEADLPFLMRIYERECRRSMVSAVRDEKIWRNECFEKSRENVNRVDIRIIETREGKPVGYIAHPWFSWGPNQVATRYELDEGVSYLAVTPSVIRYLWNVGTENAKVRQMKLSGFGFGLIDDHPVYQVAENRLPVKGFAYAFYVRVPNLTAFLRHIAPVLEARLQSSPFAGYTGELKVSFYRGGVRLVFKEGALETVEDWKPVIRTDEGAAAFPNQTFLQVVFGYRSPGEIYHIYPDCQVRNQEARLLLNTIFPKKASSVWAVS